MIHIRFDLFVNIFSVQFSKFKNLNVFSVMCAGYFTVSNSSSKGKSRVVMMHIANQPERKTNTQLKDEDGVILAVGRYSL